jgi:U3 small nucleolar RNA-associated protein 14
MYQLDKKGAMVNAPLPKAVRERLDRKAGYEQTSKEVSKWQEIVKTNREAPSLVFTQRPELCATSTAELVSKFEPCTDLEKQVASLLQENGFTSTTKEEGNELGFNKVMHSMHCR